MTLVDFPVWQIHSKYGQELQEVFEVAALAVVAVIPLITRSGHKVKNAVTVRFIGPDRPRFGIFVPHAVPARS
jgi:hypothetical protein